MNLWLIPAAGVHAVGVVGHVVGLVAAVEIPVARVGIGHEGADVWGEFGEFGFIPGLDGLDGSCPAGSVADGEHLAGMIADVGVVAVEAAVVEQDGAAGPDGDHDLLGVRRVSVVEVGIGVHAQVGVGDDGEGRDIGGEVIEVVEDADEEETGSLVAEDCGAEGLAVGVEADSGVSGLATSVGVTHHDDFGAEQLVEETDEGWMCDEIGDFATAELDRAGAALAFAVVGADGIELGGLGFESGDVIGVEQVRQDEVTFDFEMFDLLAEGEGGPVAIVDAVGGGGVGHGGRLLVVAGTEAMWLIGAAL